mmetsp:Transcript_79047/g.232075  ORF Transcript_79047/g.232075 Transcript_79047/m.232075 type:complete len:240 (+) Transcript_79047:2237-2956(+)
MPFWRCAVSAVTQMVTRSRGTVDHRTKGPTSSMKHSTETVVAHVAMARYVGSALIASIARPKSDSALEQRSLTPAVLFFAAATTPFPTRSCQTVASPMPPVRRGTKRSVEAEPSTNGAMVPAAVAATAGTSSSSRGTPRAATRATELPKRPMFPAMASKISWLSSVSPCCCVLPPKFVTITLRLTPSDWETMPISAATKWTFRLLSLFSILNSRWAPTGKSKRLVLMYSVNSSFRTTSS